jgi:hypothetical protein
MHMPEMNPLCNSGKMFVSDSNLYQLYLQYLTLKYCILLPSVSALLLH